MMESCVPPGFRFHPTDEELVGYYLRKKVASQKIDLDVIRDVDLYRIEPWHLQDHCRIGYEEQSDWYFFSYKDRKYPTGTRTNRATLTGFWKATGRDKAVRDKHGRGLIGMRKTLVFYTGRAPNGRKTDWIMHEYRLETDENAVPQEEGWVVCRAFKKRAMNPPRSVVGAWDMGYPCHDTSRLTGAAAHFKQEPPHLQLELDASSLLRYSSCHLSELPHLESPPPPSQDSLHRGTPDGERQDYDLDATRQDAATMVSTDWSWRALDRFVASQLSPDVVGERPAGRALAPQEFGRAAAAHAGDNNGDATDIVALLLLDGDREKDAGLLGSVASTSACLHKEEAI